MICRHAGERSASGRSMNVCSSAMRSSTSSAWSRMKFAVRNGRSVSVATTMTCSLIERLWSAAAMPPLSTSSQRLAHKLVPQRVRRDGAAAGGARFAREVREAAAGLVDDDLHRGDVPLRDLRLDGDLDCPLGDEHVRPEVAEAARAAAAALQCKKLFAEAVLLETEDVVVADLRGAEVADRGDANRRAVAERAVAARRPPPPPQRRCGDDAELTLDRDQRGENGDAADEVFRGIDRVDDPAPRRAAARAELLAEDAVVRPLLPEAVDDHPLHRLVDLGDRRAVGLRADRELGAEVAHRDLVGAVGEGERELEVGIHATGAYLRSLSPLAGRGWRAAPGEGRTFARPHDLRENTSQWPRLSRGSPAPAT